MTTETIFFPLESDSIEAHSWTTLEGRRFCLGTMLVHCPYCDLRLFQEYQLLWWRLIGAKRHKRRRLRRKEKRNGNEATRVD